MVRVALDVEGVLADIHKPFLEEYNALYGTDFELSDIDEWGFGRVRAHFADETGNDHVLDFLQGVDGVFEGFLPMTSRYWEEYGNGTELDRIAPVEEDVGRHVQQLRAALDLAYEEYTLDIVTARFGVDDALKTWLADHGIREGKEYDAFVTAEDKHELPYNVYVDDHPGLAAALDDQAYADNVLFRYCRPWNEHVDTVNQIPVTSLSTVAEYVPVLR